jgi:hypothetical protein
MNVMEIRFNLLGRITAVFVLLFLPQLIKSQCYEDFFGFWKSDGGKYIKLIKSDPVRETKRIVEIGDEANIYSGYEFYENRLLTILNYGSEYNKETNKNERIKRSFVFRVITVNKQLMIIRPVSEEMKSLFGQGDVTLFNENFMSIDRFFLDSIHIGLPFLPQLKIARNGEMKLVERDYKRRSKTIVTKSYSAILNENQLIELNRLILKSQIATMSICELRNQCSDCFGHSIKIFHNDKSVYYSVGQIHDSVVPLIRYLRTIISETEWVNMKQRRRKRKAANNG